MYSRHPVTPGCYAMVLLHLCCVRRTHYNALSMEMTQQFSRFCPWLPWLWPLTLTFKLVFPVNLSQIRLAVPENIWVTNKQKTKVIIALKTEPYLRAVKINVIIAKHCDEYVRLCVCLSAMISPEPHARSLPDFLGMLPDGSAQSGRSVIALLWPPYVIGGPLYFCPVISIFFFLLLYGRPM